MVSIIFIDIYPIGREDSTQDPNKKLTSCNIQSALFNFQSLLLVLLLVICTSTYLRATAPSIIDRNKNGYERASLPEPRHTPRYNHIKNKN
jgi:hypothetical protein